MNTTSPIDIALELMADFVQRTRVRDAGPGRRYLWTDAFAVCNLLELHRRTGDPDHLESARALVDRVHRGLGRHRADDPRSGWISGLPESEGRAHPTRGGLRIGKEQNERPADEPYDEAREWSRDGQYFHYLTRWMHALARIGGVTGEARYVDWAVELARAAKAGFTFTRPDGRRGLYWKMSIDLARPLVPTMGHHDALDGLLTFVELRAAAGGAASVLRGEVADLKTMCAGGDWTTLDPLGLGGLLGDAHRLGQLICAGVTDDLALLAELLRSAALGLAGLVGRGGLAGPAEQRLAFRELGLSIGLQAVSRLASLWEREPARFAGATAAKTHLPVLTRFGPEVERIHAFWLAPANRATQTWTDHRDINSVMLATSLAPDGYLTLSSGDSKE